MASFFRNTSSNAGYHLPNNRQSQQQQQVKKMGGGTRIIKQCDGEDYPPANNNPSNSFFIRSSPDRASVGAVRRRREHARKLAEIAQVEQQQHATNTSTSITATHDRIQTQTQTQFPDGIPTSNTNNTNPRPYGIQGAFWNHYSSSNISVTSSSPAADRSSIASTSLTAATMIDDPFHCWEDGNSNSNSNSHQADGVTGMIVTSKKKKDKKKHKESFSSSASSLRRTQMRLMAEEAAAAVSSTTRFQESNDTDNLTANKRSIILSNDSWEAFPSNWEDPSFFHTNTTTHSTARRWNMQSNIGTTTIINSTTSCNNSNNSTTNRKPPLASPQQQQQQQYGRNSNDIISNLSPSSTSSFWSTSKQDPPPPLSHNINTKPQRNQETPQVVAITTPETIYSSSTNTSGSYSSYNTKDTRKDRIAQLVIQPKPQALDTTQQKPNSDVLFDAFGIATTNATTTTIDSIDRYSPTTWSVATDVPPSNNMATNSLDCCSSTADLWAVPTSTSTTTTSSSSTNTTTNDEEGRRNPFKELAGTFQTKRPLNPSTATTNNHNNNTSKDGNVVKDRTSFTTARSEIGTMATSTQGSTTTTLAKAAWRKRNTTATPSCGSTSLRAESLNDTTMATATATPPSDITDTNITLHRASPANPLNRTRSSPTSHDTALETTSVVSLENGTNTKLSLWKRTHPSSVVGSPGTNTNSIASTIPWRMRLQEMKRQQQQREDSPVENASDTAQKHISLSRSSSVGNRTRYDNSIAQRNKSTELITGGGNDNTNTSTHTLSLSRSSSWSDIPRDDDIKAGNYRERRPSPVNTNYVIPKHSETSLDPNAQKLPTRPKSLPSSIPFATSSTAADSDTSDIKAKNKNTSFLHVRLKKTGSLDMLLNSDEAKRKQEDTSETQMNDELIDAEEEAINVTQQDSININGPGTEKTTIFDVQKEKSDHSLHNDDLDSSAEVEHAPPRHVAALIRNRISINMNKNSTVVSELQQQWKFTSSPVEDISDARSRLRAPTPASSSQVDIKTSDRRFRPPLKIDTSALRHLKKDTQDIDSQFENSNEEDATVCDSVLATVNGGENDGNNRLPSPKSDLSPRGSLRQSIINNEPCVVNDTALSVSPSSPNADLLQETASEKQNGNPKVLPQTSTNVGQMDADDSNAVVRSALHEALMKRKNVFDSQEAGNEATTSKANASGNIETHSDDNEEGSSTLVSKRNALHAALLKRTHPPTGSSTALNLHGIGDSNEVKTSNESAVGFVPNSLDEKTLGKYSKMLKLGLPLEAVHHAMKKDGLDTSLLNVNLASPQSLSVVTSSATSNKPVMSALENPGKTDPKYEKYFKMIKIGIPLEAVKHSVIRDGLDPSVMDENQSKKPVSSANVIGSAAAAMKAAFQIQKKTKDTVRRMRIHWETMNHASVPVNSVWAMVNADPDVEEIQIDETEFKALFQEEKGENNYSSRKGKVGIDSEKRAGVVKVIDSKRANNGGIILARVKIGFDKVAKAIDRLDDTALTPQQLQSIVEYLPTAEESSALKQYAEVNGNDIIADLCECEKFMFAMLDIRQAKNKIRCLLFKQQFPSSFEQLQKDAATVEQACDELFNSVRLRKLLGIVLNIGNKLNTAGSGQRKANAFTLESLLKLGQSKAFDKKTTVLDYVVLVVRRNNEFLTRFSDDLPTVLMASKIHWEQCLADLDEVESQLENIRKLALTEYRYRDRGGTTDTFSPEIVVDGPPLSLEQEYEALRSSEVGKFTLDAIKNVSSLRDKVELTQSKFSNLLEYFGEPGKKIQASELFAIFVAFCQNFQKANEEVIASDRAKAREDRKKSSSSLSSAKDLAKPNSDEENVKEPLKMEPLRLETNPKSKMLLRLSAMQPHMAPVIRELKSHKTKKSQPPCANIKPSDDNELLNTLDSENITGGSPFIQQETIPKSFVATSKESDFLKSGSVPQNIAENEYSSFQLNLDIGDTVSANRNKGVKSQSEHRQQGAERMLHGTISFKTNASHKQQSTTLSSITTVKVDVSASGNETSGAKSITLQCSDDYQTAQSHFDGAIHAKPIPRWQSQRTVLDDKEEVSHRLSRSKYHETLQDQNRSPTNTVNGAGDNCENIKMNDENLYHEKGDLQCQLSGAKSESSNDEASSVPYAINDKKEPGGDQSLIDLSPLKTETAKTNYRNATPRWQSPKNMREVHDDSESIVGGSKNHDTNFNQIVSPGKTREIVDECNFVGKESMNGLGNQIQDTTNEVTVSDDKAKHDFPRRMSPSIEIVSSESTTAIADSAGNMIPKINSSTLKETFTNVTGTKYSPNSESGRPSLSFSKRMDGSSMHSTLLKAKMMKRRRDTVKGNAAKN